MTEENQFPDLGEHDWTAMEQMANGVPTSDVEGHAVQVVLTEEMILKRVLWDVAPHKRIDDVAAYLGLVKTSEDGAQAEHTEVHTRMLQILPITGYLHMLSQVAARTIAATMIVMDDAVDAVPLDGEDFADIEGKFAAAIFAANVSAFAELADWDIIHTPHPYFVTVDLNEEESDSSSE